MMDHLARGLRDNGRWIDAERLFHEALRLKEEGGDTPARRSTTTYELARGLRDNGRGSDAEPLFRQAQKLEEEALATPIGRMQLRSRARGLRNAGRLEEARTLEEELARHDAQE